MQVEDKASKATDDAFLGGALRLLQPSAGYRAGVDAVLLAASLSQHGEAPMTVLDVGSGVGAVGLAVAVRLPRAGVTLIEREPELARLAEENIARNKLGARVRVLRADVTQLSDGELRQAGVTTESFDEVLANPPYHDQSRGTAAEHPLKAAAHAMSVDGLDAWVRFLARMCRPGRSATLIHRASALGEILSAMSGRFGRIEVRPIHASAHGSAIRVLVRGQKGSRAPLSICPAFVLHAADGAFLPEAEAILRAGAALPEWPAAS